MGLFDGSEAAHHVDTRDDATHIASISATLVGGHLSNPRAATLGGFILCVAVLIDGGHLRVLARKAGFKYEPDYIEKVAHACIEPTENLLRILCYDCAPYVGTTTLPVSGTPHEFTGSDHCLRDLAARNLFAVRRGTEVSRLQTEAYPNRRQAAD